MMYCIYMEKDTQGRGQKGRDRVGELWIKMENATDNDTFTALCEEAVAIGLVKSL